MHARAHTRKRTRTHTRTHTAGVALDCSGVCRTGARSRKEEGPPARVVDRVEEDKHGCIRRIVEGSRREQEGAEARGSGSKREREKEGARPTEKKNQ